jgi:molecular chaperone HtpG
MSKGKLSIHSENILPIIKKWLYSEKDIFIRELISNSCDAINKIKLLQGKEIAPKDDATFRIDITIEPKEKTITISDNGIGMTEEEVKKYIAQIAFSGAEDFLEKYKNNSEKDQIIGHFGLGFYSSYMVADKVEITTRSYQEKEEAIFWSCDGSSDYEIKKDNKENRGTEVKLHINKESEEFLKESKLKEILQRFCPFLPYPIYINGNHINNKDPLWIKNASDCTEKEYLEFYRELYPFEPDPIFWVHLNVDFPFNLKGILYFPKINTNFDITKNSIKLFCNRVFVSDNCKDILPDYLMVLRGAIDSPDIPLNVSRSYLQVDRTVKQVGSHISKKISDRLTTLHRTEKEKFISSWKDIEMIVKLGILQDEKFYEKSKNYLIFSNTDNEWLTPEEYLEKNKEKTNNKIYYTQNEKISSSLLTIFKEKKIEVLLVNSHIDTALISFLEGKLQTKFQRIDSSIDSALLDPSREKTLLDNTGKSQAASIADFIRNSLSLDNLEVEAKSLASNEIPGFIMVKEEERRLHDYMSLTNKEMAKLPTKQTFIINTNNKLVQNAHKISLKDNELAKSLVKNIYDLSRLAQKELDYGDISNFITRSNKILEKLSSI